MKRLFLLTVLLATVAYAGTGIAPLTSPKVFEMQTAQLIGSEHGTILFSGSDTLAPFNFKDTLGYDTSKTHWLQIGSIKTETKRTYLTRSDSMNILGPRKFWLWLQIDTTTFHHGLDTGYYSTGGHTNGDSTGFKTASWYVANTLADTTIARRGWAADSVNYQFVYSGNYSDYRYGPTGGRWEPPSLLAANGKRWICYWMPVPAAPLLGLRWYVYSTVKECTIVNWAVEAAY